MPPTANKNNIIPTLPVHLTIAAGNNAKPSVIGNASRTPFICQSVAVTSPLPTLPLSPFLHCFWCLISVTPPAFTSRYIRNRQHLQHLLFRLPHWSSALVLSAHTASISSPHFFRQQRYIWQFISHFAESSVHLPLLTALPGTSLFLHLSRPSPLDFLCLLMDLY